MGLRAALLLALLAMCAGCASRSVSRSLEADMALQVAAANAEVMANGCYVALVQGNSAAPHLGYSAWAQLVLAWQLRAVALTGLSPVWRQGRSFPAGRAQEYCRFVKRALEMADDYQPLIEQTIYPISVSGGAVVIAHPSREHNAASAYVREIGSRLAGACASDTAWEQTWGGYPIFREASGRVYDVTRAVCARKDALVAASGLEANRRSVFLGNLVVDVQLLFDALIALDGLTGSLPPGGKREHAAQAARELKVVITNTLLIIQDLRGRDVDWHVRFLAGLFDEELRALLSGVAVGGKG